MPTLEAPVEFALPGFALKGFTPDVPYTDVLKQQYALVDGIYKGEAVPTLMLGEHPHTITYGRRTPEAQRIDLSGQAAISAHEIDRGGEVTYHGPGQLVAYPIVMLEGPNRNLHLHLRRMEQAVIDTLAQYDIAASRKDGATGVWVGEHKIASLGIGVKRWVTFHGLALNVTTDLGYFSLIEPCGFAPSVMTSMAALRPELQELNTHTDLMGQVSATLTKQLQLLLR